MLAEERYVWILDRLHAKGLITTQEICEGIGISGETARRDLEKLEKEGHLRRVYGGATLINGRGIEPPIRVRQGKNVAEKRAIGALAASLVREGETISLDIGTTTLEVARHLRHLHQLTVLTSSIPIATELVGRGRISVYLTGGLVREGELALSGPLAEEALKQFFVDKVFIGAGGITVAEGITDYILPEAQVRRLMVERAKEVIVVADHSKFGHVAFTSVVPISRIDKLITDDGVDGEALAEFRDKGVEVLVARVSKPGGKEVKEE